MPLASVRPRLRISVAAAAATAAVATLAFAPPALADSGVTRFGGADRYATAAQTALHSFGGDDRPDTVFIASGEDYPDALAAGAAAQGTFGDPAPDAEHFGSVLLLTQTDTLPAATSDALDQLDPRRIVVVGGTGAVTGDLVRELQDDYPASVERWGGDNRYETAAEVSENVRLSDSSHVDPDHVFVASGENFPDAVAAGAIAGQMDAPLLLAQNDEIAGGTLREIEANSPSTIVLAGGSAIVDDGVKRQLESTGATVKRIYGSDRHATSVELVEYLENRNGAGSFVHGVAVATGYDYPDALAATNLWEPVLLVEPDRVPASVDAFLDWRQISWLDVVGGDGVVNRAVEGKLRTYIDGPASLRSVRGTA